MTRDTQWFVTVGIIFLALSCSAVSVAAAPYDAETSATSMPDEESGTAAAEPDAQALESYAKQCVDRLRRLVSLQNLSVADLEDGVISRLTVSIAQDGSVTSVKRAEDNQSDALDRVALRQILLASPFPRFPDALAEEANAVTIDLTFVVRDGSVHVE